jgi:probable HAF family extracellular repeat protein
MRRASRSVGAEPRRLRSGDRPEQVHENLTPSKISVPTALSRLSYLAKRKDSKERRKTMRQKLSLSISTMLLAFTATVASAQALPKFQVTPIGTAPFSSSCFVSTISDNGIMAGTCDPFGTYPGGVVVRRNGVATSLGKLPKGKDAAPHAINSFGVVTGEGDTGDYRPKAVVSYKGALLEMRDSGANSRGIGITDTGVIFGNRISGFDSPWTPVFWAPEPGKPDRYRATTLPFYNDGGSATSFGAYLNASNKAGQAVGWINGSVIGQWGGFWNNDAAHTVVPLAPLQTGYHSIAWGVNDIGQAVGESSNGMVSMQPVLWQNDTAHTVVDLGLLPGDVAGRADMINNAGQVVGLSTSSIEPGGVAKVFFYQNGAMADLSSLVDPASGTWEIRAVMSLNNAGQMVGMGVRDGQILNVLLTPIQ